MKFNSTVALTLILLVMMLGAGGVSALFGYTMGDEALKGVTQPDVSPSKKLTGKQEPKSDPKKLEILLKEDEILKKVREHIQRTTQNVQQQKQQKDKKQSFVESESSEKDNSGSEAARRGGGKLPAKGQDGGITLEVTNANQEDGTLLLEVNLKNESEKSVRFLYSFLDVKDDQGRTLSAITDGLPGEVPANGQNFAGTIKIPTALLEDTQTLSLSLTDYPDQKLQINVPKIPVMK